MITILMQRWTTLCAWESTRCLIVCRYFCCPHLFQFIHHIYLQYAHEWY